MMIQELEGQLAEKKVKHAEVLAELVQLKSERSPTDDVEFEKEQALQMMIAEKALGRVRAALEKEIAQLQTQIAHEQAEQNRARIYSIIDEVQATESKCIDLVEQAYTLAKEMLTVQHEYQALNYVGGKMLNGYNPILFSRLYEACISLELPLIASGRYQATTAGVQKVLPPEVQHRRNWATKLAKS